jgi:hypothetical protein
VRAVWRSYFVCLPRQQTGKFGKIFITIIKKLMKRFFILLIFFIALFHDFCNAQSRIWKNDRQEFFFGSGATNFLGDLGGANQIGTNGLKDFNNPSVRPGFIAGYKYRIAKAASIKTNFIYARLAGNDELTKEDFRNNRNCNFRTPLIEISSQFEYEIIQQKRTGHIYNLKGVRGRRGSHVSYYLFGGTGFIYFDPKGKWNGKWYALKPLCTEGEGLIPARKKYSDIQLIMSFGIGFKYALNKAWTIGIEYGIRKTFTDYIDDVSKTYFDPNALLKAKGATAVHFADPSLGLIPGQTAPGQMRGDPTHNDSYMLAFISFYYKIPNRGYTLPKFR